MSDAQTLETVVRDTVAGVEIDVLVAPRASRNTIGRLHDNRLKIAVTAAPIDGGANAAVIRLLAKSLHVPKSYLVVIRGQAAKRKTILARGIEAETARRRLIPSGSEA